MIRRHFKVMTTLASTFLMGAALIAGVGTYPAGAAQEAGAKPKSLGRTWENYFGVTILSNDRIIVVGDKGLVMTSDDHGGSWKRSELNKDNHLFALYGVAFAPDGSSGWAVGDGGAIYRSDDRGDKWTLQRPPRNEAMLKIAMIDGQKACAVGEAGVILCTSDGGATWKLSEFPGFILFDVAFTDADHGFAVGEFATILRTVDGGKTWTVENGAKRLLNADPFFAIAFADPSHGLIVGLNGANMETSDGGNSWKAGQFQDEHHSFFAASSFSADAAKGLYIGGADGVLGSVAQSKLTLSASPSSNAITSVAFAPHFGIAVGLAGTVMRTDNGQRWTSLSGIGHTLAQANE